MHSGKLKLLLVKTNDSIPALVVAVFGFGLALFSEESSRMSSLQSVAASGLNQSFASFMAALTLIVLALVYKANPKLRLHRQRPVGILIGFGMSICILYNFKVLALPESETAFFVTQCLLRCLNMALFACWAEVLLSLRARQMAVIFAVSLFALGGTNGLSAMLKAAGAYTIVALTPLLSIVFLYWFKDRLENDDAFQRSKHIYLPKGYEGDRSLINKQATFFNSFLVFLLPLPCFSFIFGMIHNAWIPAQDGGSISTQIQLGAALGTFLAGILLLLLITYFWGRRRIELYSLIILPIIILTFYLTTLLEGPFSVIYITSLNIVQKGALFYIWMAPYLVPCKRSPLVIWALAELLYQSGKGISTLALNVITPDSLIFMTCITSVVLVISVVIGIMLDQNKNDFIEINKDQFFQNASTAHEGARNSQIPIGFIVTEDGSKSIYGSITSPLCIPANQEPPHQRKHESLDQQNQDSSSSLLSDSEQAITIIAQKFRLTQREEEVLELLAQGMKASSIAEDLFISTSTAKSHIRNIYAKLGIHTQSELLLMVHQKESDNRSA